MRCEHGIVPVTDCYVCVSPKRGEPMADYHELPEVPKCCGTCSHLEEDWTPIDTGFRFAGWKCDELDAKVARHGLCSHWERRDDNR